MSHPTRSATLRVAGVAAVVLGAAAMLALLRGNPVQAQGPMTAPACQCSVPTPIPGMSSRIAHCLCGALACAISEPVASGGASQMQCVRQ